MKPYGRQKPNKGCECIYCRYLVVKSKKVARREAKKQIKKDKNEL